VKRVDFTILLVVVASGLLFVRGATATPARTSHAQLVDCACYDLYSIRPDGRQDHLLSRGGSRELFDVSQDRNRILWSHQINVLQSSTLTGTSVRTLATGNDIHSARFSPDGRTIVYSDNGATSACNHAALHVLDFATGTNRTLQATCASFGGAWSPDSRRIVFIRWHGQSDTTGDLVVANADGSNQRVLRSITGATDLSWSPDGSRIAYTANGPVSELHIIRADGSKDIVIARGRAAQWSPDGRRLSFLWQRGNVAAESVTIINRDGTHARVIDTAAVDPYGQGIGWSPDGRTIVYRTDDASAACSCMNLYVQRIDGTSRRQILHGIQHQEFGPLYWTRDGRTVIYTSFVQRGQ
jgi:Tol biopolymer transport system component